MCGRRNKHRSGWLVVPLFLVLIMNIIMPSILYAAEPDKVPIFFGDQNDVWCEESTSGPTKYARWNNIYPATYVGAQELYGVTVNWPHYRGEVSRKCDDYYYYKIKVHGTYRNFYDESKDEGDYKDDIRVHCLCNQMDSFHEFVHSLGCKLGNGMRSLQIGAFTFLVEIKDFNLLDILDIFTTVSSRNNEKSLSQSIKEVILMDEDGNLSPFMFVLLILWVCGAVAAVIKFVKGEGGSGAIKKEIGFLILSVILFGIVLVEDAPKKISEASIKLVNVFNTGIIDTNSGDIFNCDYEDNDRQLIMQQRGIFVKASIDNSLCAIFDCESISDLDIGESESLSWPSGYSDIGTVSNGNSTASNIGYMLWAGQSKVNNLDPYADGPNYMLGGNRNNIHWLIPDILQESGGMDNATMVKYADQLNATDTWGFIEKSFLFLLESLFFVIAEFFVVYLVLCGKIFLVVFGFLMMILPGLLLFDKGRRFATDICRTYIGSFLRVVVGNVLFMTILLMFTVLTENSDEVSTIIGILLFSLLAWNMPKRILPSINQMLMEVEGNGTFAIKCRNISEAPIKMTNGIAAKTIDDARRKRRERKALEERERFASQNDEDKQKKKNTAVRNMSRTSSDEDHDESIDNQEESESTSSAGTDRTDEDTSNATSRTESEEGTSSTTGASNTTREASQSRTEARESSFKEPKDSEDTSADTIEEEHYERHTTEGARNRYNGDGGTSSEERGYHSGSRSRSTDGVEGSNSRSGHRPYGNNSNRTDLDNTSDTKPPIHIETNTLNRANAGEQKAQPTKPAPTSNRPNKWNVSEGGERHDATSSNRAAAKMRDINKPDSARDVAKDRAIVPGVSANGRTQQRVNTNKSETEPKHGNPGGYFSDTIDRSPLTSKPRRNKYAEESSERPIKVNKKKV